MHDRQRILPVWFFIGLLLTLYGIVVLITGVSQFAHPSAVVLAQYHPGVWGGILLLLIGGFYLLRFWPRSNEKEEEACSLSSAPDASPRGTDACLNLAEDDREARHHEY